MQETSRNVAVGWVRSQTPQTDVLPITFICEMFFPPKLFSWNSLCYSVGCFAVAFLSFECQIQKQSRIPRELSFLSIELYMQLNTCILCPNKFFREHLAQLSDRRVPIRAAVRIKRLFLLHESLVHLSILLPNNSSWSRVGGLTLPIYWDHLLLPSIPGHCPDRSHTNTKIRVTRERRKSSSLQW